MSCSGGPSPRGWRVNSSCKQQESIFMWRCSGPHPQVGLSFCRDLQSAVRNQTVAFFLFKMQERPEVCWPGHGGPDLVLVVINVGTEVWYKPVVVLLFVYLCCFTKDVWSFCGVLGVFSCGVLGSITRINVFWSIIQKVLQQLKPKETSDSE